MNTNIEFTSQIGQDQIVVQLLNQKKNGIFVDIGCAGPKKLSNSYTLEKYFNWSGIGVDIEDQTDDTGKWEIIRPNTVHVINDALDLNYDDLFKKYNLPKIIDYLSLDLEPPELTLDCLYKIPFHNYTFNIITFETDEYRTGGEERVQKSRKYLTNLGYVLHSSLNKQDDLYIHESLKHL